MIRFFFMVSLLLCASCKNKTVEVPKRQDFEWLMGVDLPGWKHVQTKEDFENLAFFKKVYEQNIPHLKEGEFKETRIPKVIHFIWLGPKAFPRSSVANVRSWIAHHPDWQIKFWTDRERPLPHPKMKCCYVKDFPFYLLSREFHRSDNFGEKSDVLRYEILFNEGGIYVDHDVKCMQCFAPLNAAFDLYCGLEEPYPTSLSSSVLPTNNVLGARAGHPILAHAMDWLKMRWDQIGEDYPGTDRDSVINRVAHRTFLVLGETFKCFANTQQTIDIALPTYYFNSPKEEMALYSQHQYQGSWFENESKFEKTARKRLMMLTKKINKLFLVMGILAGLNLIGFALVGMLVYRLRQGSQKA